MKEHASVRPPASGGRILILDDDEAVGITLGLIARSEGFEYRTTKRASEFFDQLEAWQPTHLAIDLIMPEIDGVEVIRRLGEKGCEAAVIITSGAGTRVLESARLAATERGLAIAGIVSKPFRRADLRPMLSVDGHAACRAAAARPAGSPAGFMPDAPALREALAAGLIEAFFQPKIECASGRLAGFEALARWHHPGSGHVPPDHFVRVAEDSGLIDMLTARIFERALGWFSAAFGQNDLSLSINISGKSLGDLALADRMERWCRQAGVPPRRVILELTETAAMTDQATLLDVLTRLRIKGFQLSIDDFGVGYSSLVQLARLPFSELKVDRMFVKTATASAESRSIIQAVVGLGRSLGLQVTAEGVENRATLTFLEDCGCDLAQGYLFAPPMTGADAVDWARPFRSAGVVGTSANQGGASAGQRSTGRGI